MTRATEDEMRNAKLNWVAIKDTGTQFLIAVEWERGEPEPKPSDYLHGLRTAREEFEVLRQSGGVVARQSILIEHEGRERWFAFMDKTEPMWWGPDEDTTIN